MRCKNSPAQFLQFTGLYIPPSIVKRSCRRIRAITFAVFLLMPTLLYYCRQVYRSSKMFASYSITDVEFMVPVGWEFQSIIGIMFIFCWQRTGVVKFLEQAVKCNFPDENSKHLMTDKIEKIIRRCVKVTILLTVFGAARITLYTIKFAIKRGLGIFDPIIGLHPFDFLYRIIGFYLLFLINCVVSYFVTSVQCLTIQLQEFNRELEQLLQCPSKESDFADRLMDFFSMHQSMAKKVQETDKIFRIFIFCMLASGVPMMVFGTITLIRRETLVSFLMALYDLIFCVLQLTAFTVAPAQLYAELHAVPSHICWSPVIWRHFDPHLFQIARSFSENVKDLNVGLSFGGLVFIRKSSILMAIVLVVPYVILSYQLYIDSSKNSHHFNIVAKSMNRTI